MQPPGSRLRAPLQRAGQRCACLLWVRGCRSAFWFPHRFILINHFCQKTLVTFVIHGHAHGSCGQGHILLYLEDGSRASWQALSRLALHSELALGCRQGHAARRLASCAGGGGRLPLHVEEDAAGDADAAAERKHAANCVVRGKTRGARSAVCGGARLCVSYCGSTGGVRAGAGLQKVVAHPRRR